MSHTTEPTIDTIVAQLSALNATNPLSGHSTAALTQILVHVLKKFPDADFRGVFLDNRPFEKKLGKQAYKNTVVVLGCIIGLPQQKSSRRTLRLTVTMAASEVELTQIDTRHIDVQYGIPKSMPKIRSTFDKFEAALETFSLKDLST